MGGLSMTPNVHLLSFLNDVYDREPPRFRFAAETEAEWRNWPEPCLRRFGVSGPGRVQGGSPEGVSPSGARDFRSVHI